MQPLCSDQATWEAIGYHEGEAGQTLRTPSAVTLLGHSDPALGFHLETRQGAGREKDYRDAQVQGGLD